MPSGLIDISLPLFVPGDRSERFAKAVASGADGVIIDLEDAVAPSSKMAARDDLARALADLVNTSIPILVRINAAGTPWHEGDLAALTGLPIAGVILPKAERPADLERVARAVGDSGRVIALIESAAGIANARTLAPLAGRIAFGSIDFAADLRSSPTRDSLLLARLELVLASRLAGLPAPIDGVTTAIDDPQQIEADAAYAASLGFSGKLLIHPKQVVPARRGFAPSSAETDWAERVVAAAVGGGATVVDGAMVDAPVLLRARQILRRAQKNG